MADSSQIAEPKSSPPNLFSFFSNFNFQLPFFPPKPKPEPQDQPNTTPNLKLDPPKPNLVRFPKSQPVVPPPLEAEPDADLSTTKPSNPFTRWQVYALGAIIISRWIWARWNERQGGRRPPNDDRDEGRSFDDGRGSSDHE